MHERSDHIRKDDDVGRELRTVAQDETGLSEALDGHTTFDFDSPIRDQVRTTLVHPWLQRVASVLLAPSLKTCQTDNNLQPMALAHEDGWDARTG